MNALSTIVIVHDRAAPEVRELIALCSRHLALLRGRVPWASVDEVVGSSSTLPCQICALPDDAAGAAVGASHPDGGSEAAMHREPSFAEVQEAQRELQQGGWTSATLRDAHFLLRLGQIPDEVLQTELCRFRAMGETPTCEYIEAMAMARLWERHS